MWPKIKKLLVLGLELVTYKKTCTVEPRAKKTIAKVVYQNAHGSGLLTKCQ